MSDHALALTFEVFKGSARIRTAEFSEQSITIGSSDTAMLSIPDAGLAELHAVINVDESGVVQLLDLGSDAGTQVNGEAVSNVQLTNGDRLQVGEVEIVVGMVDEAAFDDEEATQVAPPPHELAAAFGEAELVEDEIPEAPAEAALADGGEEATEPDAGESLEKKPAAQGDSEDVMAFIMRSGTAQSGLGVDRKRPKVLEVNQIWGDMLLDTKHFPRAGKPITVGSSVGWRWNFLGVDLGWLPHGVHTVVRYTTPPMWSEVHSDWRNDFYAPSEQGQDHKLFSWKGGHYVAQVNKRWEGFVDVGEQRYTFEELAAAGKATDAGEFWNIPVDDDTRVMVDVDGVIFFSHMVFPGRRVLARMTDSVDYPFLAIFFFVAFVGTLFGALMYLLPPPAQNEVMQVPDRFVQLLIERPEQDDRQRDQPSANPDAGEGAKAQEEEGKVGKRDSKMEEAKGDKVEMRQQEIDRQIVEDAGVLGALRDGGALDGALGSSLAAQIDGGIGGLHGPRGTQIGAGGLGGRGDGLGGGGTAEGLGGTGTRGMGGGASGFGAGGGQLGPRGEGAISSVGGDPIILGALDRSLIDEVVRRHMNQIRYCYQRELARNPSLGGRVVIRFTIARDGTVSQARTNQTTMNSPEVESCIEGRFMRMQFPEPRGGGIVIVSYPFIFSS